MLLTTILAKNSEFVSVDSRWTDQWNKVIPTDMRKYIYADGELYLFSGDHLPILLEQAFYAKVLSEDDYLMLYERLDPEEVFGYIAFNEPDGLQLYDESNAFEWYFGLSHTGTGGKHAAQFFHFATKRDYTSKHGCNIVGALKHAFFWDSCSGDEIFKRTWRPNIFDNTKHTDIHYKSFLEQEIDYYFKGMRMTTALKSAMRTSPTVNGAKVSVTSAKSRIEQRKQRLEQKKVSTSSQIS